MWFGKDYEEFRESLSRELEVDKEDMEDCFFIRDEKGSYFLAPTGSAIDANVLSSENIIPPEWFLLFTELQRKLLYTHSGFGTIRPDGIYYHSNLGQAYKRLEECSAILGGYLKKNVEDTTKSQFFYQTNELDRGVYNLKNWLRGFDPSGIILLNYGDLASFISPTVIQNENSVKDMRELLSRQPEPN